jgi:hypothetical protein
MHSRVHTVGTWLDYMQLIVRVNRARARAHNRFWYKNVIYEPWGKLLDAFNRAIFTHIFIYILLLR